MKKQFVFYFCLILLCRVVGLCVGIAGLYLVFTGRATTEALIFVLVTYTLLELWFPSEIVKYVIRRGKKKDNLL